jgi:hypothetical protein
MLVQIGQSQIRHIARILGYSMQVVVLFSTGRACPSLELGDRMGVGCDGDPVFRHQPALFVAKHSRQIS